MDERFQSLLRDDIAVREWHGKPCALSDAKRMALESAASDHGNGIKNYFKKWPRLYDVLYAVVGPSLMTGVTAQSFVRSIDSQSIILNAGAGTRNLGDHVLNVDLLPLPEVDLVADIADLPFADNSFDAATCDQVLEHVPNPTAVVAELKRVVKPGGEIHLASPFVFPWHPSPLDYNRWTLEGLEALFDGFTVVKKGVLAGPFSAFTAFIASFLATVCSFGWRPLYEVLQYVFLIVLIPVKLLDILFARVSTAPLCAASLYIIVRKP